MASIVGNGLEECSTGFVVKDMCVQGGMVAFESVEQAGVRGNAVGIGLGLERLHQNNVEFAVECDHHVLVSTACSWREASRIISENIVDRNFVDCE